MLSWVRSSLYEKGLDVEQNWENGLFTCLNLHSLEDIHLLTRMLDGLSHTNQRIFLSFFLWDI